MTKRHIYGPGLKLVLCLAVFLSLALPAARSFSDELDDEFRFASGLIEIGFADYAEKVVQQVLRLNPDQKDRAKLIQAEILISRRRFADAEELVKAMPSENPKAQAIGLALARGYYQIGDTDKARELYNAFFKQYEGKTPTDSDLLRFYQEAAYQFGQMLEMAGDFEAAAKAYGRILATKPERNVERGILAQQAQLLVRQALKLPVKDRSKLLDEAKKLCEKVQWGGTDLWFGQSVITSAHIEMALENRSQARKNIETNLDIIKEIDTALREDEQMLGESPLAGARFLLGELMETEGNDHAKGNRADDAIQAYLKALTEYINVFAQYSNSEWGPQAGLKAQEMKKILEERYGKKVNWDLGQHQQKVAEAQFKLADNLFRQKKYEDAIAEYTKNVNAFPESETSVSALANMMMSYAYLEDTLMVKTVAAYLGERFSQSERAPIALLVLGKHYFDLKDEAMYMFAYDTYLKGFPKHEQAAGILFTLAGLKKQAGDEAGAAEFYDRIVKNYPKDAYYTRALSQTGWGYYMATNYEAAVTAFASYIKEAQPGPDKAQAQLAMADSLRMLNRFSEALTEYERIIQWLAPADNPYSTSIADEKKNAETLERAAFQRGFCYSRMNEPAESIPDFRAKGIRAYELFISKFPDSKLAPKALNGKGTIQLALGQHEAAAKTFDELAEKYPQSEEGKSALFALVRSAMEIEQYDQARIAFEKMLKDTGRYSADEFLRIGQLMLDASQFPEAIKAFEHVAAVSQERSLLERALFGKGRAQYELKDYPKAIEALSELMERYPKSGLFYDARFMLGNAYREIGDIPNAMSSMSEVLKFADNKVLINKAGYELGRIQREGGEQQAAMASFMRVALLGDASDAEVGPLVEKSLVAVMEVGMELQRYDDVLDACTQYVETFPRGSDIEAVRNYRSEARLRQSQAAPAASSGNSTNQ